MICLYAVANRNIHLHMYSYTYLISGFDIYAQIVINTFIHPICRVLARYYSKDYIITVAYFLTLI